ARRVMPPVLELVARTCSTEIFLLTVIAICFGTAWLTSLAGVSLSLGAFLAGLIVSESSFSEYAFGEILPLQILFSATFFVSVGMLLDVGFMVMNLPLVIGLVVGIIVLKALVTGGAVRLLGYPWRTSFLSGLLLVQVGEFAFVLERTGREMGLSFLGQGEMGGQLFIAASVILMVLTPFLAQAGYALDGWLTHRENERHTQSMTAQQSPEMQVNLQNHVIVAGYGMGGQQLVRVLHGSRIPYIIVTLSPSGADEAEAEGLPVVRGDGSRLYTLELAGIANAKLLVAADDDPAMARRIASVARMANPTLQIVVRTRYIAETEPLRAAGADDVIAEELESIVQLFALVLEAYQIDQDEIAKDIDLMRANGYAVLREDPPDIPAIVCDGLDAACIQVRTVTIRPDVPAVGQTLSDLALDSTYGLIVEEVQRNGTTFKVNDSEVQLAVGDRVVLMGGAAQFASSADLFRTPAETQRHTEATAIAVPQQGEALIQPLCTHQHMIHITDVPQGGQVCEECVRLGDRWVHLRMCLTCGHIGCCDSSKNKHATKHYRTSDHPIVQSVEPGEDWRWCFVDEVLVPKKRQ
ncbi:MAG: hypothetical protein HC914_05825, partial [Chloroflexaceae bacterium]|nr:hypothetical protein [Chloroflexaceae bacterium]